MVNFAVLEDQPEPAGRFHIDAGGKVLTVFGAHGLRQYDLATGRTLTKASGRFTDYHVTVAGDGAITSADDGIGRAGERGFDRFLAGQLTAPVTSAPGANGHEVLYIPTRADRTGALSLATFTPAIREKGWDVAVKRPITAPPALHRQSVYFVAGSALYRVNADTGTVCWKCTLPLDPGETLTELAFVGGEIRARGPGVLVRVAERSEPAAPIPQGAPANPVFEKGVPHSPALPPRFHTPSP